MALTLVQGYVLIGSCYLILKTDGNLQQTHYRTAKVAAITTLIGAIAITVGTPFMVESARVKLLGSQETYIFALIPVVGIILVALLFNSLQQQREVTPLVWSILIFLLTFVGLGLLVFPQIIPPSITIYQAAASPVPWSL